MRKLIPFLTLTLFATGACAQGIVTFANNVLTPTPHVINYAQPETRNLLTGTQYAAQLYYGSSASSLAAHTAAPSRFRDAQTSLAGTWRTTGATRTLTGGGVGVPVFMQVRVWDLDQFATYEAAVAGGGTVGTSAIFQYTQRLSSPPATTDTYMQDAAGNPLFGSFVFGPIPEPGVALLMIPAVVLLLFMRRSGQTERPR
jgi:hypothetical protein